MQYIRYIIVFETGPNTKAYWRQDWGSREITNNINRATRFHSGKEARTALHHAGFHPGYIRQIVGNSTDR